MAKKVYKGLKKKKQTENMSLARDQRKRTRLVLASRNVVKLMNESAAQHNGTEEHSVMRLVEP